MMTSVILRTMTRFLTTLQLLFAVFLVLRGHNDPGGGFVGGLVAAAALILYSMAYSAEATRRAVLVDPQTLLAVGLLVALGSGLVGLLAGDAFMAGTWFEIDPPWLAAKDIGTPLLFDIGVFLVVVGVTLTIILSLQEEG